jgi:hypothetical protein
LLKQGKIPKLVNPWYTRKKSSCFIVIKQFFATVVVINTPDELFDVSFGILMPAIKRHSKVWIFEKAMK